MEQVKVLDVLNYDALPLVFLLAVLVNRLVEYFVTPIWNKLDADAKYKWALMYVALVVGLLVSLLARANIFLPDTFVSPWVGMILTGFLIGGGSNLIHDVIDRASGAKTPQGDAR